MDVLHITLNEEGKVSHFAPDFKVMRGSYGNILINIEVPHKLLVESLYDEGKAITGNNVRVGAIIRTATGMNIPTKKYELSFVKDFQKDGKDYRLYQRKCPKIFTMWETVSLLETATSGLLEMVINVVNWSLDANGAKIEESWPSQIVPVEVYQSEFMDDGDEINPSDFDLLQSQVQEETARQHEIDAELFGTDADTLGNYLLTRLLAGNKITIQKDTSKSPNNQLKISVETINANEVPINKIKEIEATDVQGALEELNKRTDSKHVDTVKGIEEGLVDNTDPYNPIILHDSTKADDKKVDDAVVELNNKIEQNVKTINDTINSNVEQNNQTMSLKADLVDGKVPSSQLPSYVDDTIEVNSYTDLENITGEAGKIYVTLDTNLTYRWTGTTFVEISKSLALGETENTAYRGDRGKTAYEHSQTTGNPHNTTKADIGLSNVDNTSDLDKPISNATQAALNLKASQKSLNELEAKIPEGVKLYDTTGQSTDGSMTQKVITDCLTDLSANLEEQIEENKSTIEGVGNSLNDLASTVDAIDGNLSELSVTVNDNIQDIETKLNKNQGTANKNKTMVVAEDGTVTPSDTIYVGGVQLVSGTDTDGNPYIEFVFPEEE